MQNAQFIQNLVFKISEIFLGISFILLFIFFLLKAFLDLRKKHIRKISLRVQNQSFKKQLQNILKENNPKYTENLGIYIATMPDNTQRKTMISQIKETDFFEKLYMIYLKKTFTLSRLALFPSLILLENPKIRDASFALISTQKKRKRIPEFMIMGLFGLSLSTKKIDHLQALYTTLVKIDKTEYFSQKFSEFFFIHALSKVKKSDVLLFLQWIKSEPFSSVFYGFIYALASQPSDAKTYKSIYELHNLYPKNTMLTATILRICKRWNIKEEKIILYYHDDKDDLLRIVCSKIGLDMISSSYFPLLSHYLFDNNATIRKNFLLSLSQHNIDTFLLKTWIKKEYPEHINDELTQKSIALYETGVI